MARNISLTKCRSEVPAHIAFKNSSSEQAAEKSAHIAFKNTSSEQATAKSAHIAFKDTSSEQATEKSAHITFKNMPNEQAHNKTATKKNPDALMQPDLLFQSVFNFRQEFWTVFGHNYCMFFLGNVAAVFRLERPVVLAFCNEARL